MNKKLWISVFGIVFIFVLGFSFTRITADAPVFTATFTGRFDGENIGEPIVIPNNNYADRITLDFKAHDLDQYHFAFWIVNGVVRPDLSINHQFIVNRDMDIQVVFSPAGEHAVLFMDTNGLLLDIQYVVDNTSAVDRTFEAFYDSLDTWNMPSDFTTILTETTGAYGIAWNHIGARDEEGYAIEEDGLMFRPRDETWQPYLESEWIDVGCGGISYFSIDMRKAFEVGENDRQIKIIITPENGDPKKYVTSSFGEEGVDDTVHTYVIDDLNIMESFTIRIENLGAEVTLDNVRWHAYLPSKPGLLVAEDKWSGPLENISQDVVLYIQYEPVRDDTFNLTVHGANGSGIYTFNEVVTLVPDALEGAFSYWEIDGQIASYSETTQFTILADMTVSAVYDEIVTPEPLIIIRGPYELRDGLKSYVGQFYIPPGHTLIEYGFDADREIFQGFKYFGETKEFLMTIAKPHAFVEAYVTLEDNNDIIRTYQSTSVLVPVGEYETSYTMPIGTNDSSTAEVDGGYLITTTQTTYELWYPVRVWAQANGYHFRELGMEGSEGTTGAAPTDARREPATRITWYDAVVWLNALSEMTGLDPVYRDEHDNIIKDARIDNWGVVDTAVQTERNGYRLPTSMEWEMAARWKKDTESSDGSIFVGDRYWTPGNYASGATDSYLNLVANDLVAWYRDNSDTGEGRKTQPVGQLLPNHLGIYDMSGNVWEWTFTATTDPETGALLRVVRGGNFLYDNEFLQVGNSANNSPSYWVPGHGFRIVRDR